MKQIIIIIIFLGLLTSCSDPKPKVVYDNSTDTTENQILIDTTTITVAGLPIHFDSTNFIIHPIGQYKPDKRGAKIYMSSYSSGSSGLAVVYRNGYSVSGNLDNLKFQHIDSMTFSLLTTNQIKIRTFTFLREIYNSNKERILIYSVTDKDTNKDKKLDNNDIESLYISNIDGQKFKKLSPELQELVDWKIMRIQRRIYFITSEDIDKNGEFDKSDKLHYYYVDLKNESRNVIEYNPIEE